MDLKGKVKARKVLRTSFSKYATELETLLGEATYDWMKIQVSFKALEQKYEQIKVVSSEIFDLLIGKNESDANLNKEIDECDEYLNYFNELSMKYIETQSKQSQVPSSNVESETGVSKRKFKLPVIQFKQFDGSIHDWLSFWAQFSKIHEDTQIDLADKVEYLIQATVPGSRARHLVESFPATGENYANMIDSLKSRFGREDLQIEVYVRQLLKLVLNNALSKGKKDICSLYDDIETQLRALEMLNITSDKYAAMLFPLIESCLPEELLRVWQRSSTNLCANVTRECDVETVQNVTLDHRLKALMQFLRNEVENEQRISLASEGFGLHSVRAGSNSGGNAQQNRPISYNKLPTAVDLINGSNNDAISCVFCNGRHDSWNCYKARDLCFEDKKRLLTEKKACFRCLRVVRHQSRRCNVNVRCLVCDKPHVTVMCTELKPKNSNASDVAAIVVEEEVPLVNTEVNAANFTVTNTFMATLRVRLVTDSGSCDVRALVDTGSSRSYILETTAEKMKMKSKGKQQLSHCLFGGVINNQFHKCYEAKLAHDYVVFKLNVLDTKEICSEVSPVFPGVWMDQIHDLGIEIHDVVPSKIEILIGSDFAGQLLTGRRHILPCNLVAVETLLGWMLMGQIPSIKTHSSLAVSTLSMFVNDSVISNLWELDVLGITEPTKSKSREELELSARSFFEETITVDETGRYEVRLPWLEGHPPLPSNYAISKKRLENTLKKLETENLFDAYGDVFNEWLGENIIEEVTDFTSTEMGHYLPHRPVIKESSLTTKIRPVFDASAKQKDKPSLNQCLEKGMNLIEKIPDLFIRFRENKLGVISDIRKAFLQISINKSDRDSLRFLWIDKEGKQIIYRHQRVVFGVTCSPFLLGATIDHHLSEMLKKCDTGECPYSRETIKRLKESFYVDNCVTSVKDEETLKKFIQESSALMMDGKFDLRGWERTQCYDEKNDVPVLGLTWNTGDDSLSIKDCINSMATLDNKIISKRLILSMAQRIFDPIGFTSPVTLIPKLLLQRTWESNISWDAPVSDDIKKEFINWFHDVKYLSSIKIPRWFQVDEAETQNISLHTFCDASSKAYACVIFLRVQRNDCVSLQMVFAKSRVAPKKHMTIPRLELLSATIAARLYSIVKKNLEQEVTSYFWSDSTTVLSWIRRQEQWATFVWNRVAEIRSLTDLSCWRYVPGVFNPADLPSRGCLVKQLIDSRWYEGPAWLLEDKSFWPQEELSVNEDEINGEKKKHVITMLNRDIDVIREWHLDYFKLRYTRMVRMIAWMFRFCHNVRKNNVKINGPLSSEEYEKAEVFILRLIQKNSFVENDPRLKKMDVVYDVNGLMRLRSKIYNRDDSDYFRLPIILPSKHEVVDSLIFQTHYRSCHVGTQGLMCLLRERYWILGSRHYIKSVISGCKTCRRYSAKHLQVQSPPLPLDRVRDASVFEVTGVDCTGPLYLKSGEKVWICLFTCAVYRAVHLELITSLSSVCFIKAFRRFIDRRGRPSKMYSDCGTNFKGTENLFDKLDWDKIVDFCSVRRIKWHFNPPASPWWGGFWERLIQSVKRLLRKVLGRACLTFEDLFTVICDCEAVINARPLTYMSNDVEDLVAITPVMFLRENVEDRVPDCDQVDRMSLCKKVRRLQKIRDDLKRRFRVEYLGQLKLHFDEKPVRSIVVGEVVLIGDDNDKRLSWPLGRVIEVIPGKDGRIRLVRVATSKGELLRSIQRIYPLEENGMPIEEDVTHKEVVRDTKTSVGKSGSVNSRASESFIVESGSVKSRAPDPIKTRSGRVVKVPFRYSSSNCLQIQ